MGVSATINQPDRFTLYVLDDDEKFVEISEDTKIPNAATFRIAKQDHTLGNLLRSQLLSDPATLFAGYKVPHPLQPYFLLKIQTDGSVTPQAALEASCNKLIGTLSGLENKFSREFSFKDNDLGGGIGGYGISATEDPYGTGMGTSGAWGGTGKDYMDF